jgi:hypothetical protein
MPIPETRYARNDDVWIAYQVFGDGPVDLVFAPGFISHIELGWAIHPDRTTSWRRSPPAHA